DAATALGITAPRLFELGLIDEIIAEPLGGSHRDIDTTCDNVRTSLIETLDKLKSQTTEQLLTNRFQRLTQYGEFKESS
ncbi:MAG: acetyl-CoA carboxylase carboxyl transferase subunit alpha, partial [Gammaproteobacteria bacterium]